MLVLGIETSCDETAAACLEDGERILSSCVASQEDIHAEYGGVVPELAARAHLDRLPPMVERVLADAGGEGVRPDLIAVTRGPGLAGCLIMGVTMAKALALAWGTPLVPVHHLEAHLWVPLIGIDPSPLPFLGLVVSGGHTCLVRCREPGAYDLLGQTRDDAAGEAFDKVARILGLGYPGGPAVEAAALGGNPQAVAFPRGMRGSPSLDFSFSGLKTAVLYYMNKIREKDRSWRRRVPDAAASFQEAVVDSLLIKIRQAVRRTGIRRLVLGGGVLRNARLREKLLDLKGVEVLFPPLRLCTDNAVMVAAWGYHLFARRGGSGFGFDISPNLPLGEVRQRRG